MPFVAEHADQFRGERFIQNANHGYAIAPVSVSYSSVLNVLPRPPANFFDV
jgi:hypothetical protein